MTTIRDIMATDVVSICHDTTLAAAAEILAQNQVAGAPVISKNGVLIGFISEEALIDIVFSSSARSAFVSRYMDAEVPCIQPDEPLSKAAQLFALQSVERLPVVENGELLGIVSRRELIGHSLRSGEVLTEPLLEVVAELAQLT